MKIGLNLIWRPQIDWEKKIVMNSLSKFVPKTRKWSPVHECFCAMKWDHLIFVRNCTGMNRSWSKAGILYLCPKLHWDESIFVRSWDHFIFVRNCTGMNWSWSKAGITRIRSSWPMSRICNNASFLIEILIVIRDLAIFEHQIEFVAYVLVTNSK